MLIRYSFAPKGPCGSLRPSAYRKTAARTDPLAASYIPTTCTKPPPDVFFAEVVGAVLLRSMSCGFNPTPAEPYPRRPRRSRLGSFEVSPVPSDAEENAPSLA